MCVCVNERDRGREGGREEERKGKEEKIYDNAADLPSVVYT